MVDRADRFVWSEGDITFDEVQSEASQTEKVDKQMDASRPAFAYIPLANNTEVLRIMRQLKALLPGERIEWELAPTLHITLCYAGGMNDSVIPQLSDLIQVERMEIRPDSDKPIRTFATPDGQALHIAIEHNAVLDTVQRSVHSAFSAAGRALSEYSIPSQWQPHITLAYVPDDIDIPDLYAHDAHLPDFSIKADTVIIGRDDYDPVLVLTAPQYVKSNQPTTIEGKATFVDADDPLSKDLRTWQRLAMKRYKAGDVTKALDFKSAVLPPLLHTAIRAALATVTTPDEIYTVFDDADRWVNHDAGTHQ